MFSGSVVGPTFHFEPPQLKFENVSYGEFVRDKLYLLN